MAIEDLRYIAVEGVIGVGKTSLAARLTQTIGAKAVYEEFEKNPFLEDFYIDPEHFAFQTQIFFLLSRYQQQQNIYQQDLFQQCVISDYIFAKDRIFATLNLNDKEIQSSTNHLMEFIRKRGRNIEKNISEEYIHALNELYNKFFFHYTDTPLLVINTDGIDFVHNESDYQDILYEINQHTIGTRYYIPHKI
jgi:deoxyadenosine/deoxycytidine kinase